MSEIINKIQDTRDSDNEEYNDLGWQHSYTHNNQTNALYTDCYDDCCLDKFFYTPKNKLDVELFAIFEFEFALFFVLLYLLPW